MKNLTKKLLLTSSVVFLTGCSHLMKPEVVYVTKDCAGYEPGKLACDTDRLDNMNKILGAMTPNQRTYFGFDEEAADGKYVRCSTVISRETKEWVANNNDWYSQACTPVSN